MIQANPELFAPAKRDILIAATFKVFSLCEYLEFWTRTICRQNLIQAYLGNTCGGLLAPDGPLSGGRVWMTVLFVRLEDWNGILSAGTRETPEEAYECLCANLRKFVEHLECAASHSESVFLVCVWPWPRYSSKPGAEALLAKTEDEMVRSLEAGSAHVLRARDVSMARDQDDCAVPDAGAERPRRAWLARVSQTVARRMYAMASAPYAAIAIPRGVPPELIPEVRALTARLKKTGRAICVGGGGDWLSPAERDGIVQMPAEEGGTSGIPACARQLGIPLSDFVVLAWDQTGCQVQNQCSSEPLVVKLPANGDECRQFLRDHWAFDPVPACNVALRSREPIWPRLSASALHHLATDLAGPARVVEAVEQWRSQKRGILV